MTVDTIEIVKMIRSGDKMGIQIYLRKGGNPNARNQMCWTLLHLACFEGQLDIAEVLLEGGASVNSCSTDMCTPLHRACGQGNKTVVEMLLKRGAYINAQDRFGNTPLHDAARGFHTSIIQMLMDKKADKSKVNKKNQTFLNLIGQQLMPAVESGDSEVLLQWLEWGASPDTKGNLHWSILHHASARGQLNIASLLIEKGADVNIEDSNKTTPLHSACFHGHARIASLLIDSKANINPQDQRGNTPLHSAVSGGNPDLVNILLDRDCDTTIANKEGQYFTHLVNEFLVTAVDGSKVAQVVSLIKGRADPNTRDPYGYTVLCQAAFKGDLLITDALLEGGANPNLTCLPHGKTPLHYAAAWNHLFVLKALLDSGATVNIKDKAGATPLHEATREGYEDVMVVLLGRGAHINEADADGNTPLHIAGQWGQNAAVEFLLEKNAWETVRNKNRQLYSDLALIRAVRTADRDQVVSGMAWGGDPNSRDRRGWTLLHHAAYKGVEEICFLLLDSGANVNALDHHDRTPLLLAAYRGNHQIMEMLLDAGADINTQDWMGRTPLHWAAKEGSMDSVQMLLDHKATTSIINKEGDLYSDLLLKHLYFAVRHNDADKVVRLVMAGADQLAEVEGTGISPIEEAKRRGFYDIARQMAAVAKKRARQEEEKIVALEDIYRLFEDGDFSTPEEDQEKCEEEADEEEDRDEQEDDNNEDEDAYWKMSNAYEVLTVEEAFGKEDGAWLKEFEEKPKVISAKELLDAEQAAFWDGWQEKQKVISAKELFKEETNWWEKDKDDNDKNEVDDTENSSNEDQSRNDECWWRDAQEKMNKSKAISAKELFKEKTGWWEDDEDDKEEVEEEEEGNKDGSPEEYFKHDPPWWQSEVKKGNVISSKDLFEDGKPWWQQDEPVPAKEYFEEDKPWWQDDKRDKAISSKEYFKEETPWWQTNDEKVISAKEFFKDEEQPWWYTEEMHPEKPEGLKKSLASVQLYERNLLKQQMSEAKAEAAECDPGVSDDEVEESTRTDDYEDATDSLISDSSTMYSASEGERSSGTASRDILCRREGSPKAGEGKQTVPKAKDYFQEKHWLDDASDTSEPTETLDMDTSELSEMVTTTEVSHSESWHQEICNKRSEEDDGSYYEESEIEEEEDELEEEEIEEEEGVEEEEEVDVESEELEEEEENDDEMGEKECNSESEDLKSENDIQDISDEELENVECTKEKSIVSTVEDIRDQQTQEEPIPYKNKVSEIHKEIDIPTIVLHEISNENEDSHKTSNTKEPRDRKDTTEFPSVELISKVVSKSDETLEKESTNIDIGVTNNDSVLDPNNYSISVHDIEGNLQKSDSQTSGYDSSLSLSESKIKDLSKDSGCEALSADECVEDTDLSDMTNTVSTETTESLEESISIDQDYKGQASRQNTKTGVKSQEVITEIMKESNENIKEDINKIFIQMKWDKEDEALHQVRTEDSQETLNSSKPEVSYSQSKDLNKTKKNEISIGTQDENSSPPHREVQEQITKKTDCSQNQTEVKTYASAVKSNLEKVTVNKMDDCLARLDASLAWVDARLTKENEERTSNEQLHDKMNDNKDITYEAIVKNGKSSTDTETQSKIVEDIGTLATENKSIIMEEKDTIQFMKVHVHVPEEESVINEEQDRIISSNPPEKRRFAGGTVPKKIDIKGKDANKFDAIRIDGNDYSVITESRTEADLSSANTETIHGNGHRVSKKPVRDGNKNRINESSILDESKNTTLSKKGVEKENELEAEIKNVSKESIAPCDKVQETLHSANVSDKNRITGTLKSDGGICDEVEMEKADRKELSRESSFERLSSKEGSQSPSLQRDKTLWRCSTYDTMSISDYDNLAFMIQKSASTPANWGSKKKRKECLAKTDSLDQAKEDFIQESSEKTTSKETDAHLSSTSESKEEIGSQSGELNSKLPADKDSKKNEESGTSTGNQCGADCPPSSTITGENLMHHNIVPEASSVPLPGKNRPLGAEACTNLREPSCNQDPPVAPRRTKESSLMSQNVKYKNADHSADNQPSSSNALKQPTNYTLYDPDKKETSIVEAAINVRPDEPRVQQVSTKRSKESNKKDKEKQKELAVATGKIDPVRKSSSCSVS